MAAKYPYEKGLSIEKISKSFKLSPSDILNVYVVGSHLWGTVHKDSDWDLVIVVKVWSVKPADMHSGLLDAHILSKEQFVETLALHNFRLIACIYAPVHCKLKETIKFEKMFKLDKIKLRDSFFQENERDNRIAEKHANKGRVDAAKTICVHTLRLLMFGEQICLEGGIVDYQRGRDELDELKYTYFTSWDELSSFVLPKIKDCKERILALCI
ncbi:hypothetical protein LOD99_242 [Oopsacas minuta]|uniref:Polymerase nucleotidyl transferase domain-containing protein n=1 Tax=Oopsacas minuta TaxID=111878 RepID=A0AAV7K8Z2_9METZ|nr:hypothetical protein LOD99_242 [Oopsacas minuta]